MSRKRIAILISVIAAVAAAVTAVIVFRRQIAAFIELLEEKFRNPSGKSVPRENFTDEERESFADI